MFHTNEEMNSHDGCNGRKNWNNQSASDFEFLNNQGIFFSTATVKSDFATYMYYSMIGYVRQPRTGSSMPIYKAQSVSHSYPQVWVVYSP
jgi:hypothetical protein